MPDKNYAKRNAILECLSKTKVHPSADEVHRMLMRERSDISLATVYRNLALFKKEGMIQSVATVNGTERYDYNTEPHVHFICQECEAVIDLDEMEIPPQLTDSAVELSGGLVEQCNLSFIGVCKCCKNKAHS